jgi:hypothetical protein
VVLQSLDPMGSSRTGGALERVDGHALPTAPRSAFDDATSATQGSYVKGLIPSSLADAATAQLGRGGCGDRQAGDDGGRRSHEPDLLSAGLDAGRDRHVGRGEAEVDDDEACLAHRWR